MSESEAVDPPSRHRFAVVWLLMVLLVAGAFRIWNLDAEGLWLDEYFSMELSAGNGYADQKLPRGVILQPPLPALTQFGEGTSYADVWKLMAQDTHPPLYFLLLRTWRGLLGSSDWTVRFFSVMHSLLAIAVLFRIALKSFGLGVAVWASLLMSVSVPQIVYAQEARNNPLMLLCGLLAMGSMIGIDRHRPSLVRLIGLGAALLGMMFTHYYSAGVAFALFVYAACFMRQEKRVRVLITFAISGMFYAIAWGPMLFRQRDAFARWHPPVVAMPGHFLLNIERMALAPLRQMIALFNDSHWAAFLVVICFILVLVLTMRQSKLRIWWMAFLGAVGIVASHDFLSGQDHLLLPKYTILSMPAIAILIVAGAWQLNSGRWLGIRYGILVSLTIFCLFSMPAAYMPYRGQSRDAGGYILMRGHRDDLVVFCGAYRSDRAAGWNYLRVMHYYDPDRWPTRVLLLDRPIDDRNDALLGSLRGARSVFVVIDSANLSPQKWLPGCNIRAGVYFPHTLSVWEVSLPDALDMER